MFRRLLILCMVVAALAPVAASAQSLFQLPIVQCGGDGQSPCTPCYLFQTIKNTTDVILYGLTGPIAAFMFVLAGGMMLIGADNVKLQSQARSIFTNTVYGVAIIFLSWLAVNFLIKSVATGDVTNKWNEFTCPGFLAQIQIPENVPTVPETVQALPPSVSKPTLSAASMQILATVTHTKYPAQNAPDLNQLIALLYTDPVIQAIAIPQADEPTFEKNMEICNYTRGDPEKVAGCAHAKNSCHYGGETGTAGAEAVDMNAKIKPVSIPGTIDSTTGLPVTTMASEELLFCRIQWLWVKNKLPNVKLINWESSHTHVSTKACTDGDGHASGMSASAGLSIPNCADSARYPQFWQ